MWRRVAGGLNPTLQNALLDRLRPALLPAKGKGGFKPQPNELAEMWRTAASLERVDGKSKEGLAQVLLKQARRSPVPTYAFWALTRLGARVPFYGPLNCVVPRDAATAWVERLLAAEWPRPEAYAFALAQLARATGDRERDLDLELRERLARRLETAPQGERAARIVRQPVALEAREEARLLDEALPAGLRLRDDV